MKELLSPETKEILREFAAAIVAEQRKPEPPTTRELANLEQAEEERRANAEAVKQKKANERWDQEHGCTHEHPKNHGGGSHCVYVRDNDVPLSPGFVLCQKCQGRFRPDEPIMRKLDPSAIFDTAKFNRLLSDCMTTGAEILA